MAKQDIIDDDYSNPKQRELEEKDLDTSEEKDQ